MYLIHLVHMEQIYLDQSVRSVWNEKRYKPFYVLIVRIDASVVQKWITICNVPEIFDVQNICVNHINTWTE